MNDRANPLDCQLICWWRVVLGAVAAIVIAAPCVALICWALEIAS